MKKTLNSALTAGDIPKIREILIKMAEKPGNITTIQEISAIIEKTPGLFEPDDGKIYAPDAASLTQTSLGALREDIKKNFSLKKFHMLIEAREILRTDPHYYDNRPEDTTETVSYGDETLQIDERLEGDDIVAAEIEEVETAGKKKTEDVKNGGKEAGGKEAAEPKAGDEDGEEEDSDSPSSSRGMSRKFGYLVLLLGLAAAIVGICVPVRFLVGLGIGVLMLGAAIVYASISRKDPK